ncbi:MAG: glycosyltransferase family 4 protein [Candidatus Sumerlaeaceae bacterium]|nr:glycosyltransferase family 4 protein [Candidatus Sumerlaeaceae bacterium]
MTTLRVALDARMIQHSGIGTYIRGLGEALVANDALKLSLIGSRDVLVAHDYFRRNCDVISFSGSIYSVREQLLFPRECRRRGISLLHFPHYNVPRWPDAPFVVTIHDLIHLLMPEVLGSRIKAETAKYLLRSATRRAAKILTVSNATKQDLEQHLGVPAERIVVTPNAVSPRFQPVPMESVAETRKSLGLPESYILAVGINKPHKNFPFLISSFGEWRTKPQAANVSLVISGIPPDQRADLQLVAVKSGVANNVRFLDFIPHGSLAPVYQAAKALVFPSLMEGFGLPILEAQRVGTPVIVSNASAIPEVAADSALYFDPRSTAEFCTRLDEFFSNAALRTRLAELGRQNERRFSWASTAAATLDAYRSIAS